jgi:catabolite repression protein CreC
MPANTSIINPNEYQGTINAHAVTEIRWIPGSESLFLAAHADGSLIVYDKDKDDAPFVPEETESIVDDDASGDASLHVSKSVNSKNQKFNPVACWSISRQPINAFAFAPDCKHLAVVTEDGCLRIIDYLKEK